MKLEKRKGKQPIIISGPCSAETHEQTLQTCMALSKIKDIGMIRAGVWKPRTRPDSFEGVGLDGLAWLQEVKQLTGLPIAVEVATASHVEAALKYDVDALWIGARTTVSPFAVQSIADALRGVDVAVMIKNPMHPDLQLWSGALERMIRANITNLAMIHRGFATYSPMIYRNNPMWHLAIEMMMRYENVPMICDPSHICGTRELLYEVSQAAADMGFDGLILESHINPECAWSDSKQQLTPSDLAVLLDRLVWRDESLRMDYQSELQKLRIQIDNLDNELLSVLSHRMKIAEDIGDLKNRFDVKILQAGRWDDVMQRMLSRSQDLGLSKEFLIHIMNAIHIESINHQNLVMNHRDGTK